MPLPLGVWLWLVSPEPYVPRPASGRLPQDVLRDNPLPLLPHHLFRPDRGTFRHTLVRLPAARDPGERLAGPFGRLVLAGCRKCAASRQGVSEGASLGKGVLGA